MEETLNFIYQQNLNYRARWNTSLANHVTMAASAMFLMRGKTGVTEQKILADAARYSEGLSALRSNDSHIDIGALPEQACYSLLGNDDLQESWQAYFESVFSDDIDANIILWLTRLGAGLSAAAGHSLLRLYFALAVRDLLDPGLFRRELAVAFADLASRYCELSRATVPGPVSLDEYLADHPLLKNPDLRAVQAGTLMEDRFLIVNSLAVLRDTVDQIDLDFDLMACLRSLAAIAAQQPDIGILHTLTVGQALSEIFTWYPELGQLPLRRGYRDFVVAIILVYQSPNARQFTEADRTAGEIYQRVATLENDHAQKASFSLTRLHEKTGYPEMLEAASVIQNRYG